MSDQRGKRKRKVVRSGSEEGKKKIQRTRKPQRTEDNLDVVVVVGEND